MEGETRGETEERGVSRAEMRQDLTAVVALVFLALIAAKVFTAVTVEDAGSLAGPVLEALLLVAMTTVLVWVGVFRPLLHRVERRTDAARERERRLRLESGRQEFDARLYRALEMIDDEPAALRVVARAIRSVAPTAPAELLLADSSRAHLRRAVEVGPDDRGPGCGVESPRSCAAVRRGQTMVFPSSGELDACAQLHDRPQGPCSAVCVPVSVMGRAIGVVHTTGENGAPAGDEQILQLEAIATQTGTRIGMIRAFTRSEVQATTDPLTGLLNRRSVENAVRVMARKDQSFAVAMGDLDHFKVLNDTHGHDAGDRALRLFAQILTDSLRPDDLVARYGGEEFVVIFPDSGQSDAAAALERVREALALAITAGGTPSFTASFGVTDTSEGATLEALLPLADAALMAAKALGRNRVLTATALRESAVASQTGITQTSEP